MRITAILNLKGGVAKTTTAINLGSILHHYHNRRVLLIDCDSQGNLTEFFGVRGATATMADLLRVDAPIGDAIRHTEDGPDIIPGDDTLMDLDLSAASGGKANINCLLPLRELQYDNVIIDCPPAFNAAAAAALVAADDVLIPIRLDAFSLRGMGNLMTQVSNMRAINPSLRVCGILPTMYTRDRQTLEAAAELKMQGFEVYNPIRQSPTVTDMTYKQQPLWRSSPRSGAGLDYKIFAERFVEEEKQYGI